MSIIGIGIDIIQISRIKKIINKFGNKFIKRILSKKEWKKFLKNNNINFVAKRFAVKEAISKSFGTGLRKGINFKNFELYHNSYGKPKIKFLKKAKIFSKKLNIQSIHISITDEKKYICAVAIIE